MNNKTAALVVLLFTRLTDLFGSKVFGRGLVVYADSEKLIYSEAFKLWCRKLEDLTEQDFKTGMAGIEQKAEAAYREGEELWPPSYAEFRALAYPKTSRDAIAHKYFEPVLAIEDQTEKAKRYELGKQKSQELLGLLGSSPERPEHSDDKARAALEIARKRLNKN